MASNMHVLVIIVVICSLIFFEVAAEDNGNLFIARRELSAPKEIAKDIYKVYKHFDKRRGVVQVVNWTFSEAEKYVDQQCHNSQQYCCLNNDYLQCQQCCQGPRPNSSSLHYLLAVSPAPSPLPPPPPPSTDFPVFFWPPPSTSSKPTPPIAWEYFLLMFVVIICVG